MHVKLLIFGVGGGHSVKYFSGSRADGFRFHDELLIQHWLKKLSYSLTKIYEKYVIEKLFNFSLSRLSSKGD